MLRYDPIIDDEFAVIVFEHKNQMLEFWCDKCDIKISTLALYSITLAEITSAVAKHFNEVDHLVL